MRDKKTKEQLEKELMECINHIEQNGADARFQVNNGYPSNSRLQIQSIQFWSKKAIRILDKIDFGG